MSDRARLTLQRAGVHYTIPTVADLPSIIEDIDLRLRRGERP
jgi:phosphonoacetaldehyde hydrolase